MWHFPKGVPVPTSVEMKALQAAAFSMQVYNYKNIMYDGSCIVVHSIYLQIGTRPQAAAD